MAVINPIIPKLARGRVITRKTDVMDVQRQNRQLADRVDQLNREVVALREALADTGGEQMLKRIVALERAEQARKERKVKKNG
jgi:hypothetical protein